MSPEFNGLDREHIGDIQDALSLLAEDDPEKYVSPTRVSDTVVRRIRGRSIPSNHIREYLDSLPEENVDRKPGPRKNGQVYRLIKEWI